MPPQQSVLHHPRRVRYRAHMKKALVTGGCGFLGSAIVKILLERGVEVRIGALPGEKTTNVDAVIDDVEIVRGDVREPDACVDWVSGMDTVFHCAAIYKDYAPDPTLMYEVNNGGTFNMMEACRREGVRTVVYTASIVSLGRPPHDTLGDENTKYNVWTIDFPYSRSKYHSRNIAEGFARWGLDVRVVCPAVVFGPGDVAPTPSGKLIIETMKGAPPLHVPGGSSWVDVRDAAMVHVLAAEKGKAGERYIASGGDVTNEELLRAILNAAGIQKRLFGVPTAVARAVVGALSAASVKMGKEPQMTPEFFEYSLQPSFFSSEKSQRELGATYRPIDETIRDAIASFRERGMIE